MKTRKNQSQIKHLQSKPGSWARAEITETLSTPPPPPFPPFLFPYPGPALEFLFPPKRTFRAFKGSSWLWVCVYTWALRNTTREAQGLGHVTRRCTASLHCALAGSPKLRLHLPVHFCREKEEKETAQHTVTKYLPPLERSHPRGRTSATSLRPTNLVKRLRRSPLTGIALQNIYRG